MRGERGREDISRGSVCIYVCKCVCVCVYGGGGISQGSIYVRVYVCVFSYMRVCNVSSGNMKREEGDEKE